MRIHRRCQWRLKVVGSLPLEIATDAIGLHLVHRPAAKGNTRLGVRVTSSSIERLLPSPKSGQIVRAHIEEPGFMSRVVPAIVRT